MPTLWKRLRSTAIFSLLLAVALFPAAARADSAGQAVSIKLKLGNDYITVNDKQITIETPYVSNGSTLVPLRVITTAFGAVLTWDSETQTVGLKYGSTSITLKIGSTTATVNGASETLETAAELKNGTTMVPLRFLSEKFGAKVAFDEATTSISITGSAAGTTDGSAAGIDSDLGKTHIGNSFYGWSMKYPSGLVQSYQSFKEDYVSFSDANGEFRISVQVLTDLSENLSQDALLGILEDESEAETVLEKKYVTDGPRSYARLLTKSGSKIYESRAYQKGDKVYELFFTINKEENFKTPSKYNGYKDLMDSFSPAFDSGDKTLKDLSTVKDGLRTYTDATYGITLKVPADWTKSSSGSNSFNFYSPKRGNYINITLTSKKDGDTLEAWLDRRVKSFTEAFVPEYLKMEPTQGLQIDGNPALRYRNNNTFDLQKWDATENVFFIKGNYKYEIHFQFDKQEDLSESLIKSTLDSVKIDAPSSSIGTIKDALDDLDRTKTSVYKNKSFHYSITVPSYWKADTSLATSSTIQYSAGLGRFMIAAQDDLPYSPQEVIDKMKKNLEDKTDLANLKETENRTETIAGEQAKWIAWETKQTVTIVCTFEHNGTSYMMMSGVPKAGNTEAYKQSALSAIKSFQFTN